MYKFLVVVFLSFILSASIFASNLSFLNYSSVSYFQGKDTDLMVKNAVYALDHMADGKKSTWKNPQTGSWGYAIPMRTLKQDGKLCRDLKVVNIAHQVTGESNYRMCKVQGEWKIYSA